MDAESTPVVDAVHDAESAVAEAISEARDTVANSDDQGTQVVMGEMKTRLAAIETALSDLNTSLRAMVAVHTPAESAQKTTTETEADTEEAAEAAIEDHTEVTTKPKGARKRYPGRKRGSK